MHWQNGHLVNKRKHGRPHLKGQLLPRRRQECPLRNVTLQLVAKDLSSLEAYLSHYNVKKSDNKPELIKRIEEHTFTVE